MRWWTVAFAAVGVAHAAGAAEIDAQYLRGSMLPGYPVAEGPPLLADDAAPLYPPEAAPSPPPVGPQIAPWTGFYVGGLLNLGNGTFHSTTSTPSGGIESAVNGVGGQTIKPLGVAPGLTAGYNWQSGNAVLGLEADIQALQLSGGALTGPVAYPGLSPATFAIGSAASANWLLTVRPRIGWAGDGWLVYGTTGAAVTNINAQFSFADDFGSTQSTILSTTRLGFAAGGGVEAALDENWSAKLEYLYVHFSPVSVTSNNLMAFPATPVPTQPFTHSVDLSANLLRLGLNYRFAEPGQAVAAMPLKAPAIAPAWSWTGFYAGGQVGAAASATTLSDPFGTSVFGDTVRSPGFLAGVQGGYNWQAPGTRWVFGIEADANRIDADGTATCFAASSIAVNATCRVRPQATATLTGRFGYALDPVGRSLVYGKAGAAWASSTEDMALGNALAGFIGPNITSTGASFDAWGWTLGVGVEYALTPAWSMKFEYDYLAFGSRDVPNLGSATFDPLTGALLSATPPGSSGVTQNIQTMKMGVNYKFGGAPFAYAAEPLPPAGWQVEAGARYFGGWGQFHKDIGTFTSSGLASISSVSRLTYDDLQTTTGEFFGRVDLPWGNMFVKGYVGGGLIKNGHMNDEDFGIPLFGTYAAYSNTLSPVSGGSMTYGVVDAGFDFLRGSRYKLGAFAGYFDFSPQMKAFGCTPLANVNCIPPVSVANSAAITEFDEWRALRIGLAGEAMVANRLKLSGEVAYLPQASFAGTDQHFFGNSGFLASNNPESGNARGVQLEVLLSYYVTPEFSVGFGGRYWGMWTTNGQVARTIDDGVAIPTSSPQFFKGVAEQAGAFVQAAYCFGPEWF